LAEFFDELLLGDDFFLAVSGPLKRGIPEKKLEIAHQVIDVAQLIAIVGGCLQDIANCQSVKTVYLVIFQHLDFVKDRPELFNLLCPFLFT
jgi:hypothetical protein